MSSLGSSLAKLTITAYPDREQSIAPNRDDVMEVQYNPTSIQMGYSNTYLSQAHLDSDLNAIFLDKRDLGSLTLELVFDATLPGSDQTITEQLAKLNRICNEPQGERAETPFLRLVWGRMQWHGNGYFAGRMTSMSVRHNLFDRNGMPLRASVSLSLIADESMVLQHSRREARTPKKARLQVVGQSHLPLLAASMATVLGAESVDHLALAVANDLDHLDAPQVGSALIWPASRQGEA